MTSILIVEDEAILAMENKMILERAGYKILPIASNAKAAIDTFNLNRPELILMDIKLKDDMDGVDIMIEIRKNSNTPVIFLTGNSDPKTKQRIKNITNSSFLLKPTLTNQIINEVNKMLLK